MQVVGVGTKALAEAAHHNSFNLSTLGSWQEGKPVPFAFLADVFEAIAQVSASSSPEHLCQHCQPGSRSLILCIRWAEPFME